jgi:ElaB/YqjD/DUF883 family membrane-anchored ribosome-binding protein
MATSPKNAEVAGDAAESVTDLAALQKDIHALKKDVANLLGHLQDETVNGARGAAQRLEKQAEQIYRSVANEGQKQAEALSHRIETQPLTAVLVAAGIGYISGRLLSR